MRALHETDTMTLLDDALNTGTFGKIAAVSSFGAESAALLHLISRTNRDARVIFIDTRMMFQETLDYKTTLIRHLGLTNVHTATPSNNDVRARDAWGRLHLSDPDACCNMRKTTVLDQALAGYDGWITGRKRYQALTRSDLELVEQSNGGRIKLNPLAFWSATDLAAYSERFDLPQHALVEYGYRSIGCASCTSPVAHGEDGRAGRWRGQDKIECGIHFENGRIKRQRDNHA